MKRRGYAPHQSTKHPSSLPPRSHYLFTTELANESETVYARLRSFELMNTITTRCVFQTKRVRVFSMWVQIRFGVRVARVIREGRGIRMSSERRRVLEVVLLSLSALRSHPQHPEK
jgi:hypothetical protein